MRRLVRGEAAEGLDPLALGRDRTPAAALIGGHDDVDESLEEVALVVGGGAPGGLEGLVRVEEPARPGEGEAVLVRALHDANVVLRYGDDPPVRSRSLHPRQARSAPARASVPDVRRDRSTRSRDRR